MQENERLNRSRQWMDRARRVIPGGVNSPVRALQSVGGTPFFAASGDGAWIRDEDGNRYLDYVLSWGPLILGHRHPAVVQAVQEALQEGMSYGAPTAREVLLAERICDGIPGVEMVRLVNSGTEATMSAVRVARGFTGRPKIVKFEGCYHGHADFLLVRAGSGALTFGTPDSAGVPAEFALHTLTVPYNDPEALQRVFQEAGGDIAAVIVEPVVGNMGVVAPTDGFLEALDSVPRNHGALLIVDEVMTGFRLGWGGVFSRLGLHPDLVTLGKVIGGGLPLGAYGGRREVMEQVSPLGSVYQAGTLSGNPLSVAAGIATLEVLDRLRPYDALEATGARLEAGLREAARDAGIPVTVNRVGSMFTVFFTPEPVRNLEEARRCDTGRFGRWFHRMRDRGVSLPPSQFEAAFLSVRHGDEEVDRTLAAAREAFREA